MAVRTRPTFDEPAISYCCPAIATPPVYLELVARMNVWGRPCRGAARDCHDQAKWHTERGSVSVSGQKFVNWHRGTGGGGAIDLVMHLAAVNYPTAVAWLEDHFGITALDEGALDGSRGSWQGRAMNTGQASGYPSGEGLSVANREPHPLRLPPRDRDQLKRVRRYLVERRCLRAAWLEPLIASGKLYADPRGNAVFLLLGKADQPVGAELRGTSARVWRGDGPRLAKGPRLLLDWCGRCEGDRTL